jgi:branched-chain amino acid transport system substrate-binding protein
LARRDFAQIAVLMQNDDYVRDYHDGFREGLGKETSRIVKVVTYEATAPTVDSQIFQLKDSGADVFFNVPGANHQKLRVPLLVTGILVNTSPTGEILAAESA